MAVSTRVLLSIPKCSYSSNEFPVHKVKVDSFYMDVHEVTNQQFLDFVNATGYITTAEKPLNWNELKKQLPKNTPCLLYTSPSPRDGLLCRMPSSA